ncbi:MAG: NAD-binding protein [Chloroflexi bacterium]|nr:NAD-binding protein [Chloroflexota bacterium]
MRVAVPAIGSAAFGAVAAAGRRALGRTREIAVGAYLRTNETWAIARREGIPRIVMVMLLVFLGIGGAVYFVEVKTYPIEFPASAESGEGPLIDSLGNAFWWTIVTMTTTGYGDLFPKTTAGRLVGSVLMMAGVIILSLFTASFASLLVAQRLQQDAGLRALKVRGHIVVIGANRHLEQVLRGLAALAGRRTPPLVLINDLQENARNELLYKFRSLNISSLRGDPSQESILVRANVVEAAAVILLADEARESPDPDQDTLFAALAIRHLQPDIRLAAHLLSDEKEAAIRSAGVDEIVVHGQETSYFLASGALTSGLIGAARQLLTNGSGRELQRVELPRELRGRTFREARAYFRQASDLLVGIISEAAVVTIDEIYGSSTDWVDEFIRSAFRETGKDVVDRDTDRTDALIPAPDDYVIGAKDFGVVIGGGPLRTSA